MLKIKNNTDDLSLINDFNAGNRQAFNLLVQRYQQYVLNICYRYLANEPDARDAAQDIFIKVFDHLPGFRPEARFSTWLYRIVVNHCLNVHRAKKRRNWLTSFSATEQKNKDALLNLRDDSGNPEKILEDFERNMVINKALNRLNEQYKTVIILHRYMELSYKEIAEILNVSIPTIESRLFRARLKLAELLKDYFQV